MASVSSSGVTKDGSTVVHTPAKRVTRVCRGGVTKVCRGGVTKDGSTVAHTPAKRVTRVCRGKWRGHNRIWRCYRGGQLVLHIRSTVVPGETDDTTNRYFISVHVHDGPAGLLQLLVRRAVTCSRNHCRAETTEGN